MPKEKIDITLEYGKIPPQALELEEAILGILLRFQGVMDEVSPILKVDSFYKESHGIIYQHILDLYREKEPIDTITVSNKLKEHDKLDEVGGAYALVQMTNNVTSSANATYYAGVIQQKYIKRELIRISTEITVKAFEDNDDFEELISFSEKEMISVSEKNIGKSNMRHISEIGEESEKTMGVRILRAREGKVIGVTSGIKVLDRHTQGWQPTDLIIVAARPSIGKSACMVSWAKAAALDGVPVCIYSLEMSGMSLYDRVLISWSGASAFNYKSGRISDQEAIDIKAAREEISKLPIYIDDTPAVSMSYVRNHTKQMKKKGLCGLVLLDFLQLGEPDADDRSSRENQVSKMSRMGKLIAKEMAIPMIIFSQLNRECEREKDKKPDLHHLRESGAIEQDADIVILLHRPNKYGITEMYERGDQIDSANRIHFIIAKHREGSVGTASAWHSDDMTTIRDHEVNILDIDPDDTITSARDKMIDDDLPTLEE